MRRLIVLLSLLAAAPAAAFDGHPMNELEISSSRQGLSATAGSGCVWSRNSGGCADVAAPPQYKGRLMVRRGKLIAFDFDWPVEKLAISTWIPARDREEAGHPGPAMVASLPPGASGARRWQAVLPEDLPDGPVELSLGSRYREEDQTGGERHFYAALHVIRRNAARSRVPRLAGMPFETAIRQLERRGLRWQHPVTGVSGDSGPLPPPGAPAAPLGRVVRQSIAPGRLVRRSTVVRLRTRT